MEEKDKHGLNEKQLLFCRYYVSKDFFASGVESYGQAYGIDIEKPSGYNTAKVMASKLLTNANILAYINELLDLTGLNSEYVDKQLLFVISQNADLSSKVSAIREYNKLKQRITDKIDLKVNGSFDISLKLE
jgi:phage terminase small subunit